ncbi:signal peptidase II [Pelagirhabdus alkalitolerans]|uniref:signal peptidase II n=1 Tax=Pelagirhabdus alkalitolerans TaxID=1612202 RepID=UPI002481B9A9|nr:signal peptidase II [Pelagirhabdus alkalitolerans]
MRVYYYLLAIIIIALDQMTKRWVVVNMELRESIPVIEDIFYITSHRNPGAAWGILQDQMYFFYIVTIIVIGVIVYYMTKYAKENMWIGIGLGLVLGGAIGNFIDRLIYQEVVDFLNVYIGTYNYPIFNVADSALVVGVIILAILTIKDEFIKG